MVANLGIDMHASLKSSLYEELSLTKGITSYARHNITINHHRHNTSPHKQKQPYWSRMKRRKNERKLKKKKGKQLVISPKRHIIHQTKEK